MGDARAAEPVWPGGFGSPACVGIGQNAYDLCAEGWLDTSHLRGGAGPGRASCIGGATFSHRQNSSTPLKHMQIGESHNFYF
ncbi:hypothetical protein PUN28_007423 [Cardiocondyla obscurior]|uniref:Uncharacterized protein n=1 Tax=Cardiocondyla obscurior TaxID=286306 RepID=A0AAW2G8A5_9HYME